MNLALHGFLLQVFVSILNFQHGSFLCSAGEPGYLDFDNLPETNFSCQGKVIGGYYADVEAGCQMFHVCTIGQKDEIMDIKFLCLNGTVFDQETRVCERVDEVDCSKSERFYNLNLELYGNNAVTLSLHENTEEEEDPIDTLDDHQQRTTSARPTTTSTTSTTTSRPSKTSSTPSSAPFSHPTGYPQHYQPQPPFPQVHTSQSKSLYDDKNGGYHHQYIFHNGERSNSQATSYQLFSSQGVSSTTVQAPQVHQIRYSSTVSPQIIHNEPSTVTPLFHTSSTIQTLLNNGNSPALINPIFHNHGIASTTEHFSLHSNNPRDTSEYRETGEQSIRPLEAVQSTNQGKISKLTISPVPSQESQRTMQTKSNQNSQQRIPSGFLPTPATIETTIRSFYPTPRSSNSKSTQSAQSSGTQHIHVPPPVAIPQLKPHQITINLPPPDIQRIVQNPSPLLPSQSRVIVTAKASVSDESGRPLNSSQLVTLPLPTIPASYDDYKEGDESFDPFYRDVPKIRGNRETIDDNEFVRRKRSLGRSRNAGPFVYDADTDSNENLRVLDIDEKPEEISDLRSIKESLMMFRKFLLNEQQKEDMADRRDKKDDVSPLKDLVIGATRNLKARKLDDTEYETDDNDESMIDSMESLPNSMRHEKQQDESVGITEATRRKSRYRMDELKIDSREIDELLDDENPTKENLPDLENKRVLDVVILGTNEHVKSKSEDIVDETTVTEMPVISTSEEITESTIKETTMLPRKAEENTTAKKKEAEENKEEMTQRNGGERRQQKSGAKRISARIKSRGRGLRRKQNKNNVERQKIEEEEEEIVSPSALVRSIGKIDSRIFKDTDSQAPKDLDTRAVDQRNRNAVKDSEESKSHAGLNSKDDLRSKDYKEREEVRIEEEHQEKDDLRLEEKEESIIEEDHQEKEEPIIEEEHEEDTVSLNKDDLHSEEKEDTSESSSIIPNNEEETTEIPTEVENATTTSEVPDEDSHVYKEEIELEHHEAVENVDTTIKNTSPEGEEETSSIHQSKISLRGKSMKFEESLSKESSSDREDKSRKIDDDDESIITVEARKINEESSEFFTESSLEITRDFEEEHETESEEAMITSTEEEQSEEVTNSKEEVKEHDDNSTQEETSTEGVLKFTDELPKSENKEDSTESFDIPESTESIGQDYVDDNYEPENYKEREDSAESNELTYNKESKDISEDSNETKEDESDYSESTTLSEEINDDDDLNSSEDYDRTLEEDSKEDIEETTIISTSSTTTTTTIRPKLFKPIAARKNYNYIPPTTTPNPVIIKPRIPLLNPKPAKPPKSYNELVPKPVIRKLPLLTRKFTTTTASTTTDDDHYHEMTTETMTTTENARSDENILESKLEKNETMNDQESSSSQEKSLSDTNDDKESIKHTENFTPYPILRTSTLTTIGKILEEAVTIPTIAEDITTTKSYSLLDMNIINTTTAATITMAPKQPEIIETSTLEVIIEESSSIVPLTSTTTESTSELPNTSTSEKPVTSTESEFHKENSKVRLFHRKPLGGARRQSSFNCLEREMYRFYGDNRDCRLFHYCSPGFTSRQVLDFRFVCEEGTAFDEESQSCRHDVRKEKCPNRSW